MADSDEEQLNLAIALSLQQHGTSASLQEPKKINGALVDLTADSDDEVTPLEPQPAHHHAARKTSKAPKEVGTDHTLPLRDSLESKSNGQVNTDGQQQESHALGILGLDRKQMEQARLARLQRPQQRNQSPKRKASISPPPLRRGMKISKTGENTSKVTEYSNAAQESASPTRVEPVKSKNSNDTSKFVTEPKKPERPLQSKTSRFEREAHGLATEKEPTLDFPNGAVKKTWADGYQRNEDIKIEEVLQKSSLQLAVLSSFQWDMDWLLKKIRVGATDILFVMQAKDGSTKRQYESEVAAMPRTRVCCPPMEGQVNCMHSKLMLLFHPEYLRIVVPSANLVPYDWGEQNGVMENTVFLVDLPRLEAPSGSQKESPQFYEELVYFCNAMKLQKDVIERLSKFDFSRTSGLAFVHTIGGSHCGEAWKRTGYCGVAAAVASLGLKTSQPIQIDYVTSSLGSLTYEFLQSIYRACQGDNVMPGDSSRLLQKKKASNSDGGQPWRDKFHIYYPTKTTVLQSKGGPQCGGTICFQSRWYNKADFPREAMRDCVSQRPGMLMHNKILFVRFQQLVQMAGGSTCVGWAYVGSANLSESALGRLVQDRSRKEPKLNCRNWECGVIVPIMAAPGDPNEPGDMTTAPDLQDGPIDVAINVFDSRVPVPMVVPGRIYGAEKPWYYSEQ